jgi:signal peptidase complex subunit 3
MHNNLNRIQNVFGYFTSVAFAVAAAIAVSVLLSPQSPRASLELRNVQVYVTHAICIYSLHTHRYAHSVKGRPHYYSTKREEYAHVKFDLDAGTLYKSPPHLSLTNRRQCADLSSLFNWNTKQVFVYITASYPSSDPSIPPSESVIWDAIIPSDLAPAHPNTYIHPTSKSTSTKKTKGKRKEAGKPYPPGTKPGILKLSNQKPKYQIRDGQI